MITTEKVELEILSKVSKIANSTLDFDTKLNRIVGVIADRLGRDVCYVVLRDKRTDSLMLKAAVGLEPESIGKVMLSTGEGVAGWVALHKQPVALEVASEDQRYKLVPQTGEDRYKSLLAVPILFNAECIGVMTVQTVEPHLYSTDEITLLSTIANDVGGIINSAQLYQEARQNLDALSALYEVSRALISTLDLQTLLDRIARSSAEVIGAKGCILRLLDSSSGLLEIKSSYGLSGVPDDKTKLRLGESIAGRVASENKPMLIANIREHPDFLNATGAIAESLLCVPLSSKGRVLGTIALYDKETPEKSGEQPFTPDDLNLLTALASQAAVAVENAFYYERAEELATQNENKAKELSFLYDMANAMRLTLKVDKLLHIILTAMTMGGGLGFNRAMLFLVNERTKTLQGMLGIGPASAWEAGEIWSRLSDRPPDFRNWFITDDEIEAQRDSSFNRMVKGMRISYEEGFGVFHEAVTKKQAVNVGDAETDPLAGPEVMALIGARSFAAVPLVAKDRVIALVVVDNKFTGRPITDTDIRLLMMFASQAGLAMESSLAYSNLEQANRDLKETQDRLIQSEKMAALGEMAAAVAHEIKNPLTVIGGFAVRLSKKQPEGPVGRYAKIISDEAGRLEKILNDVLDFSRDKPPHLELFNINSICEDTAEMYAEEMSENGITLHMDLMPGLRPAMMDPGQIKQALINVLANSLQAMEQAGGQDISIKTLEEPGGGRIVVEINDTGGGMPPEVIDNIFNPFFTTKDKGTGLGLAITNKIIKNHGGEIEVINREGVGATFTIKLP
jgi:two-component system, NtrC family, sensor histidine kinase HydH